jgi:nitrite reductase/ring-hydroxylating ferredoxin subunit
VTERSILMGPTRFLPQRGFVVVPVLPPHKLPDGTFCRSALLGKVKGEWVAYANVCRHLAIALDMGDGNVMDGEGWQLVCHHHGAVFRPEDGWCEVGPCYGEFLWRFAVRLDEDDTAFLVVGGEEAATPEPKEE